MVTKNKRSHFLDRLPNLESRMKPARHRNITGLQPTHLTIPGDKMTHGPDIIFLDSFKETSVAILGPSLLAFMLERTNTD